MFAIIVKDNEWSELDGKVNLIAWAYDDKQVAEDYIKRNKDGRTMNTAKIVEVEELYQLSHASLYELCLTLEEAETLAALYKEYGYHPSIRKITKQSERWEEWDEGVFVG